MAELPKVDSSNRFEKRRFGVVAREKVKDAVAEPVFSNEEDVSRWVSENSEDVNEILGTYEAVKGLRDNVVSSLPRWQQELSGVKVKPDSFYENGDRNHATAELKRGWLSKDGRGIDELAHDLSDYGVEVTNEDVVDFMMAHPSGKVRQSSEEVDALGRRFSEVASQMSGMRIGRPDSPTGKLFVEKMKTAENRDQLKQQIEDAQRAEEEVFRSMAEQHEAESLDVNVSQELDYKGNPFVLSSNGTADFGVISKEQADAIGTGVEAPVRLSRGNEGYGKIHIDERLAQLKQNGYNSTENFVVDVVNNYDEIRSGNLYTDKDGETKETFLLVKRGDKGSVLYVELAPDGGYYDVNSGGVFKNSYIEKRDLLWNASTEHSAISGESQGFPLAQLNPESDNVSALPQSESLSTNKDIEVSGENKEAGEKSVDAGLINTEESVSLQNNNENNGRDKVSEPVSQGEYRAVPEEVGGIEERANQLRRGVEEASGDASQGEGAGGRSEKEINRMVESKAKEGGLWIPMSDLSDLGSPFLSGNENNNYLDVENGTVYKMNNLMNSGSLRNLFLRIDLHNTFFPQTRYSLVGFTGFGNGGAVYPIYKQRFVANTVFATEEEIDGFMRSLGFEPAGEAAYSNGEVVVSDLRPRNVLKDADGDVYVVDAEFKKVKDAPTIEEQAEIDAEMSDVTEEEYGDDGEIRYREVESSEDVNERFNRELDELTEENADRVVLNLGIPSDILLSAGVSNKPMKLYGNKVIKKMKKHGFALSELENLPRAVANPIAVFDNSGRKGNRSILTELETEKGNVLVSLDLGKGMDMDFNIVSSAFGKGERNIMDWINRGYAMYINKEKALDYLHHPALIAETSNSQGLSSATNIIQNFENPSVEAGEFFDKNLEVRFRSENALEVINDRFNRELQQQIDGKLPKGHVYQFGKPSDVLRSAGIPDLPIELSAERLLAKASKEYDSNHPFDLKNIENLPEALNHPIAVFDARKKNGGKVVLTELKQGDNNFVVALHVRKSDDSRKIDIEVNSVRSLYPKDRSNGILDWINGGLMNWVDKEKAFNFFSTQWPNYIASGGNTESSEVLSSATNILQNFQNPSVEAGEISSTIDNLSDELGVKVNKVKDRKDLPDGIQRRMKSGRYPGLYDPKSGKVYVVMNEITDVGDAQATVLHEVVGHKGVHGLFGDKLPDFCRRVLGSMDEDARAGLVGKHGGNEQLAAEEYVAGFAEGYADPTAWERVKAVVKEFLRDMGVVLRLSDGDLMYVLWKGKNGLREGDGVFDVARKVARDRELQRGLFREELRSVSPAEVNRRFNEDIDDFTEDNALSTIFNLGNPSECLLSAGIANKPIRLYGSKVLRKMKKHGFKIEELRDLPNAVARPIAVFDNVGRNGNRSVLTNLKTVNGNFLVTIDLGKGTDVDFDVVSSVFGKSDNSVLSWINKGLATYIDKEKALGYLRISAPIAEASNNQELVSATNIVENFENPSVEEDVLFREVGDVLSDFSNKHLSLKESAIEEFQDRMLSVKMLLDEVRRRGGKVTDYANPYVAENLASSRSMAQMSEFNKNTWNPLMESVESFVKKGKSRDEVGCFQWFKDTNLKASHNHKQ